MKSPGGDEVVGWSFKLDSFRPGMITVVRPALLAASELIEKVCKSFRNGFRALSGADEKGWSQCRIDTARSLGFDRTNVR